MSLLLSTIAVAALIILALAYKLIRQFLATKKLLRIQKYLLAHTQHEQVLITEIETLKDRISDSIQYDAITKLPTRYVFDDRIKQTLLQSQRHKLSFGVLFLNLDGFKYVNDVLGYQLGDQLLKEVANRLRASIRQTDTVCRFSGDTFVFILPQLAKAETAVYVARRLLDNIAEPIHLQNQELYLTACIGIANYPEDGDTPEILIKNADNALHQAKSRGTNQYQFYRNYMQAMSRRELILNSDLHQEKIWQELFLDYQPQIDTGQHKIISMEALLRWQHPDFGLIGARDILRFAESSNKIFEIGEWVLRSACTQLLRWREANFFPPTVSVNVSLRQIEHPHFVHKVSQILQETKIDPAALILEISESTLSARFDMVEKTLNMLKHLGVQIAVDDFGTGGLSLQMLLHFPVHYLKIDQSFVHDLTINQESKALCKMIIALAKSLNMKVIAEGVETQNQKAMLQELGCAMMQGHLFCQPKPANVFPGVLKEMSEYLS